MNTLIITTQERKRRTVNACIFTTPQTSELQTYLYLISKQGKTHLVTSLSQISSLINGGLWITLMLTWDIEHFGLSPFLEDSTTVESISTDTPGKITLCLKSHRNIYIYLVQTI